MDNQQVSHSEETFKQHQQYDKLLIGSSGTIRYVSTGKTVYVRVSKAGYLEVGIRLQGKRLTLKVHRLVAECHQPKRLRNMVSPDNRLRKFVQVFNG
jgi:pantoate kinase